MGKQPKNWPQGIIYLNKPVYHSSISKDIVTLLKSGGSNSSNLRVGSSPTTVYTQIRHIQSETHPAHGQLGLFSSRKIPPHTMLLWYLGEVHADQREESDYDLSLMKTSDGINIGVDAQYMGNEARCINDYRGVAERPNALFQEVRADNGELRMSVWSGSREIRKNEEILVSYGRGWWSARRQEHSGPHSTVQKP